MEAVVQALNETGARYLIVGGLAVVAHGHLRFTADIDLVLDFDTGNLRGATAALGSLGYRPRAPVSLEDFIDSERRATWVREKGLTVFSLYSSEHAATEVDLFVEPPFDFDQVYARAVRLDVAPGLPGTFVGLEDLIALKRRAGRPQDALDVEKLLMLKGEANDER